MDVEKRDKKDESLARQDSRDSQANIMSDEIEKSVRKNEPTTMRQLFHNISWFIFGTAALLAWNAFVTNTFFFKGGLVGDNNLFTYFEPSLSACSMLSLITGNMLNLLVGYRIPDAVRVLGVKTVLSLCFLCITVIVFYLPPPSGYFAAIMVLTIIMNVLSPLLQTALYNDVSYFPSICLTLYLGGQAFAGVFVSVVSLLVVLGKTEPRVSAVIYFAVALAFLLVSITLYTIMIKSKWFLLWKDISTQKSQATGTTDSLTRSQTQIYIDNFKNIWKEALSLYLILLVTLAVFPTVTIQVRSIFPGTEWGDNYFIGFHCFLIFNLFDLVGRYTPMFIKFPKYGSIWFVIIPILRIVFLFLFLICYRPNNVNSVFPTIFKHDIIPIIIMAGFSLINGHFICVCFGVSYTNSKPEDIKACSTLLVFALGFGLATGAFISFGLASI